MGFGVKLTPHLLSVMFRTGFTLTAYVVLRERSDRGSTTISVFDGFASADELDPLPNNDLKIMFYCNHLTEFAKSVCNLRPVDNSATVKTGV